MKRIFVAAGVALMMVACNSGGNSSEDVKDSVMETIDSAADQKIDSIKDTTEAMKDKVESTFDKTDSANDAQSKKREDTAKKGE